MPSEEGAYWGLHESEGDLDGQVQLEHGRAVLIMELECAKFCVERTPCSPEQTRALNALDEVMFLFNAAIARNEG